MAISDVSITSSMRNTLTSLQSTSKLLDRTQNRLATGKKVNSALDNPLNFFAAQAATQRASDLSGRKDGISEAIQGVLAANTGVTGITALIESAKGLTQSARSSDRTARNMLAGQFNGILDQITQMAQDSQYKGKNFLGADTLQVLFNENGSSFINIAGFDASATALGLATATIGTADVTTANISGGLGLSTAATEIHTATMNATFGQTMIATGFIDPVGLTGAAAPLRTTISGGQFAGVGNGIYITIGNLINMTGTYFSGGLTASSAGGVNTTGAAVISEVYANGVALAANLWTSNFILSGAFSGLKLQINSNAATVAGVAGLTNTSITTTMITAQHVSGTNTNVAANNFVYDLTAGDFAAGAQVTTMVSGATATGTAVPVTYAGKAVYMMSGTQSFMVSTGNYTFTSTGGSELLIFNTNAVPTTTAGAIRYNYNLGYSNFTGPVDVKKADFTGIALLANQSITNIKVDGASANHYVIAGNVITFSGGFEPAVGARVTYDVITAGTTGTWEDDSNISAAIDTLDIALQTLRTSSQTLGSTQNILDIRTNFTDALTSVLLKGADNLTLADMNEEGANMLMLQTRQSLGTSTLKMASDSAQAIMRLF